MQTVRWSPLGQRRLLLTLLAAMLAGYVLYKSRVLSFAVSDAGSVKAALERQSGDREPASDDERQDEARQDEDDLPDEQPKVFDLHPDGLSHDQGKDDDDDTSKEKAEDRGEGKEKAEDVGQALGEVRRVPEDVGKDLTGGGQLQLHVAPDDDGRLPADGATLPPDGVVRNPGVGDPRNVDSDDDGHESALHHGGLSDDDVTEAPGDAQNLPAEKAGVSPKGQPGAERVDTQERQDGVQLHPHGLHNDNADHQEPEAGQLQAQRAETDDVNDKERRENLLLDGMMNRNSDQQGLPLRGNVPPPGELHNPDRDEQGNVDSGPNGLKDGGNQGLAANPAGLPDNEEIAKQSGDNPRAGKEVYGFEDTGSHRTRGIKQLGITELEQEQQQLPEHFHHRNNNAQQADALAQFHSEESNANAIRQNGGGDQGGDQYPVRHQDGVDPDSSHQAVLTAPQSGRLPSEPRVQGFGRDDVFAGIRRFDGQIKGNFNGMIFREARPHRADLRPAESGSLSGIPTQKEIRLYGDEKAEHDPIPSDQHDPIPSDQHDPIPSDQHDPIPSDQHDPIPSDQHDPIPSDQHDAIPSDAHRQGPLQQINDSSGADQQLDNSAWRAKFKEMVDMAANTANNDLHKADQQADRQADWQTQLKEMLQRSATTANRVANADQQADRSWQAKLKEMLEGSATTAHGIHDDGSSHVKAGVGPPAAEQWAGRLATRMDSALRGDQLLEGRFRQIEGDLRHDIKSASGGSHPEVGQEHGEDEVKADRITERLGDGRKPAEDGAPQSGDVSSGGTPSAAARPEAPVPADLKGVVVDLSLPARGPFRCQLHKFRLSSRPVCTLAGDPDTVTSRLLQPGGWEEAALGELEDVLDTSLALGLVDLGAGLGLFTLAAATNNHRVLSVEPLPSNWRPLHSSIQRNSVADLVTMVTAAVGQERGVGRVTEVKGGHAGSGVVQRLPGGRGAGEEGVVTILPMDALLPLLTFHTAVVRLGLHGAEPRALRGADRFFSQVNVRFVLMPWAPSRDRAGHQEMAAFLKDRGFEPAKTARGPSVFSEASLGLDVDLIVWRKRSSHAR